MRANAVYMKAGSGDFYMFSNRKDEGFEPCILPIVCDERCSLVVSSNFKLKKIREKVICRLDIYMSQEDALALGRNIRDYVGMGRAREAKVSPYSTWKSGTRNVPRIIEQFETGCHTLLATAAGRVYMYDDPTGTTSVYVDLEDVNEGFEMMEGIEVHIGIALNGREGTGNSSGHYIDALKSSLTAVDDRERLDPAVFGCAYGVIVIDFARSQFQNLGSELSILAKSATPSQ